MTDVAARPTRGAPAAHFVAQLVAQLLPPLLICGGMLVVASHFGAGSEEIVRALVAVVLAQIVPGALIWRLVRPVRGWLLEDLVMGLAVGAVLAVPTQLVAVATGLRSLTWAVPALVAIGLLAAPRTRRRVLSRAWEPLPWGWATVACTACAVPLLRVLEIFRQPVRWDGWASFYVDVHFHIALVGELLHRLPTHYPQVTGEPLTYHWFSYAWTAHIAELSGAEADTLLLRLDPVLLLVAVPLAIAFTGARVTGSVWVGAGSAVAAFLVQEVQPWTLGSPNSTPLHSPLSPTQQFGMLVLMPAVALIALRWRREVPRGTVVLLVAALAATGGAKGSTLPVVVAGLLLASVLVVLLRAAPGLRRLVWADTALSVLVLVVLQRTMFAGGGGGIRLMPPDAFLESRVGLMTDGAVGLGTPAGVALATLVLVAMLSPFLAIAVVLLSREGRRDPTAWLLTGAGISGICAVLLLGHPGSSQYYFYFTALGLVEIAVAWGVSMALRGSPAPRTRLAAAAAIGFLAMALTQWLLAADEGDAVQASSAYAAVGTLLMLVVGGAVAVAIVERRRSVTAPQPLARTVALVSVVAIAGAGLVSPVRLLLGWEPPPSGVTADASPGQIHSSQLRALRWLRDHSDTDDVVATNLHCRDVISRSCDHRHFAVAAYTERRVLVEGWAYTDRAIRSWDPGGDTHFAREPFWDQELLELNDGFIREPTADGAARLYELGVRWLVVDSRPRHAVSLAPYAEERRTATGLTVHELIAPD